MAAKNISLMKTHYLLMSDSTINPNTMYKFAGKWGCVSDDKSIFVKVSISESFRFGRAILYGVNYQLGEEPHFIGNGKWQQLVYDVKKIVVNFNLSKINNQEYKIKPQNVKLYTWDGGILTSDIGDDGIKGLLEIRDTDCLFFTLNGFANCDLQRDSKSNWVGYGLKGLMTCVKRHPIITIILIIFVGAYIYGGLFN